MSIATRGSNLKRLMSSFANTSLAIASRSSVKVHLKGAVVAELWQVQVHRVFLSTNAANRRAPSVAKLNTDESISHASKQKGLGQY